MANGDWNPKIERSQEVYTRPQPSAEPVAVSVDAEPVAVMHEHDDWTTEFARYARGGGLLSEADKRHGWRQTLLYPASALEAARRKALEPVLPLIEAVAGWERQHGSACAMLPSEYAAFMEAIKPALLKSACRAVALKENSNAG